MKGTFALCSLDYRSKSVFCVHSNGTSYFWGTLVWDIFDRLDCAVSILCFLLRKLLKWLLKGGDSQSGSPT
ncbi:MAG: hypothetical protein VYA34_13765 [Myxococcota bacterium]|nr:hypothetical protein [Myxococcota bacterium]